MISSVLGRSPRLADARHSGRDWAVYHPKAEPSPSPSPHLTLTLTLTLTLDALGTAAVIGPGDGLFIPAGCWHHVRSLTPSWSINFWF